MLSIIHLPALLAGIAIGTLALWIRPDDRVVYVYPTPENIDKIQYKDATGGCFEYSQSATKCPIGGGAKAPIQ